MERNIATAGDCIMLKLFNDFKNPAEIKRSLQEYLVND